MVWPLLSHQDLSLWTRDRGSRAVAYLRAPEVRRWRWGWGRPAIIIIINRWSPASHNRMFCGGLLRVAISWTNGSSTGLCGEKIRECRKGTGFKSSGQKWARMWKTKLQDTREQQPRFDGKTHLELIQTECNDLLPLLNNCNSEICWDFNEDNFEVPLIWEFRFKKNLFSSNLKLKQFSTSENPTDFTRWSLCRNIVSASRVFPPPPPPNLLPQSHPAAVNFLSKDPTLSGESNANQLGKLRVNR